MEPIKNIIVVLEMKWKNKPWANILPIFNSDEISCFEMVQSTWNDESLQNEK